MLLKKGSGPKTCIRRLVCDSIVSKEYNSDQSLSIIIGYCLYSMSKVEVRIMGIVCMCRISHIRCVSMPLPDGARAYTVCLRLDQKIDRLLRLREVFKLPGGMYHIRLLMAGIGLTEVGFRASDRVI